MTTPALPFPMIDSSVVEHEGTTYGIRQQNGAKHLIVAGDTTGFDGQPHNSASGTLICDLSARNAAALRERLPWLRPVPLGLRLSAGFGDRLGVATPGHVAAVHDTGVAPIFAQQSVRENTRTGRTPQRVLDDAMWGVMIAGWRDPWGADADHLKRVDDIAPFVAAGYTFYTIDPGDHVDDEAERMHSDDLRRRVEALPWDVLQSSPDQLSRQFPTSVEANGVRLVLDEPTLYKAAAKYGRAVAHTVQMAAALREHLGDRPFDLEMSVDETNTTTSLIEHFYIASELQRLGVPVVSLAPRFVGRFEKGVDYIGDLGELELNIAGHGAIMQHFGNRYKLSLHTGSDKFEVYPLALKYTGGRVHLKTAGTSYLEALRVMTTVQPPLFREILDFARDHYEEDRRSYHVSADLKNVPAATTLNDEVLPRLLNQFDARQVLHVTFGSVLDHFGDDLRAMLRDHEAAYHDAIRTHFDKHLEAFAAAGTD